MNNLVQLKGKLYEGKNRSGGGGASLSKNQIVTSDDLKNRLNELKKLEEIWSKINLIEGALISVYYSRIVPKSRRIRRLFSKNETEHTNNSIVGAKFTENGMHKHIITHYLSMQQVAKGIDRISKCIAILDKFYNGKIDNNGLQHSKKIKGKIQKYNLSASSFATCIVDLSMVEKFDVLDNSELINDDCIITLYETNESIKTLLEKIGITLSSNSLLGKNTVSLKHDDLVLLKDKAPYLIAMSVEDISLYSNEDFSFKSEKLIDIPSPSNEPVVGVIDTLFDETVYFKDWVEYEDCVDSEIPKDSESYIHGTAVTSIIVDGASINPNLDDGCGRFRVKHFGVAVNGRNNSSNIIRNIKSIVERNRNIKVWNISLGSSKEVNPNFISPEAALLDEIQYENDVLFIIAGTNKDSNMPEGYRIGSPADSINALVVNSVDINNKIASYSRKGKVLSFFNKPDLCYFGGDTNGKVLTCIGTGANFTSGTSFAAPWIARKASYLIDKLGLTREIAKTLLIDSAIGWNNINETNVDYMGYGIVPQRIEDVINSPKDEIKFYIEGRTNAYEMYTHSIPVPMSNGKYPFVAKATMCYFPKCSRNQGVDYTDTELDIYFGRIKEDKIHSINENKQAEGDIGYINEENARNYYRKWDNVKHIYQIIESRRRRAVSPFNNIRLWGLSIKTKERLDSKIDSIKFGVLITLKEINGQNRYDDFIKLCTINGWLPNIVDANNRIEIYNNAEEDIEFE